MVSYLFNVLLQTIECIVCFSFYENITSLDKKYYKRLTVMFTSYLIMCFFNLAFNYNIVVNTLVMVVFHFLFSYFLYKQSIKFSVIYSVLITSLVTITELSTVNLLAIVFQTDTYEFIENTLGYVLLIVFSKSFMYIILIIIGNIINKHNSGERANLTYLLYPISLLIVLTLFTMISHDYNLSDKTKLIMSISIIIFTFSVILTCLLQQKYAKNEKELFELKSLHQQQELDKTYFDLLEHQNNELQMFVHDTKKHLANLYDLYDNANDARNYIKSLVKDIDEANQIGKTSNRLLDLIINKYDFLCNQSNISFEKNIHKSNLNFISDNDLTVIFNNLLDNAIEAAKLCNNKYISLSINQVENIMLIDLLNSCYTPPVSQKNVLLTTKKEKSIHGYGFKSITKAVKKYSGDIEWEYKSDKKEFLVSIIFTVANK
ncbi:MAG: GHKL domain-containing protein [Eubacterium sp.]|nr:GHKL domain-containing protein [Eubacterium sp.]